MTNHFNEDDLTLYYYGEGAYRVDRVGRGSPRRRVDQHLERCPACASLYHEIAGTLAMVVAPEVPERGDQYGLEVWQRLRHNFFARSLYRPCGHRQSAHCHGDSDFRCG